MDQKLVAFTQERIQIAFGRYMTDITIDIARINILNSLKVALFFMTLSKDGVVAKNVLQILENF